MTLLEAISARHSVRKYLDKEIPADIIAALQDKIAECNKVGNLSIQLVQNETKAFTGMLSYGSFSGVKNYLVMVGKSPKTSMSELATMESKSFSLSRHWVSTPVGWDSRTARFQRRIMSAKMKSSSA